MKVGIDISSVVYGRGVSLYTTNLVHHLAKRKDVELFLYGSSLRQTDALRSFVAYVKRPLVGTSRKVYSYIQQTPPSLQEVMWYKLGLNKVKSFFPGIDVFHSWDWLQPPDKDLPIVSTIHDLAILKFPETAHPKILKMHQQAWASLKAKGAEVIAVSQSTKKDIVELLDIPASKVHVIHEALPQETVRVTEALTEEEYDQRKDRLKLTRPYLLFVGTREPRKNLMNLIEAWQPLAKDYDLLIAGESGWDETSAGKKFQDLSGLRFLGRVSDQDLAVLYGEAEVFCYPSLYEGFGLPILEAFYHGTPVVTSDVSSMPEVAGNAAELVDPTSVTSIRQGIKKILNEEKENQQRRLQKMIIRLQLFNWERVAEETVKVYQRAMGR